MIIKPCSISATHFSAGSVLLHLHGRAFKSHSGKSYFVDLLAREISADLVYISSSTYRSLMCFGRSRSFRIWER